MRIEKFRDMGLNAKFQILFLLLTFLILALTVSVITWKSAKNINEITLENATNLAKDNANEIEAELNKALATSRAIAGAMDGDVASGRTLTREQVNMMLKKILEENPDFLGAYVGFEPNAFDGRDADYVKKPGHDATGRFVPYWNRIIGAVTLDPLMDYDKEGAGDYYLIPKKTNQEAIIEPYVYGGALMTSLIVPIRKDGRFIGIAGIDINLYPLNERVKQLKILNSGYGFLLSNKGVYAAHPNKLLIGYARPDQIDVDAIKKAATDGSNKSILSEATPDAFQSLAQFVDRQATTRSIQEQLIQNVQAGKEKIMEVNDAYYQKTGYLVQIPLHVGQTPTPWGFVVSVPKGEILGSLRKTVIFGLLVTLIALILFSAVLTFVIRKLVKPILAMNKKLEQVATGDLTVTVDVNGRDEIGQMSQQLNTTVDKISDLIGQVLESMEHVQTASNELTAGNRDLSQRTQEQASTLEEVASTVELITTSIQETAANSHQADRISQSTMAAVQEGENAVVETMAAMSQITESSKKIGDIIKVVNDIAFQTNLLALNAAVEAARAGEQGRGFAVVAAEVRNLAGRTAESSKEIEKLIKESVDRVEKGNLLVQRSGEMLKQIVQNTKQTSDIVIEIAAAVREQSASSEEIQAAIEQLNQVTQQNAAMVQEIAASSESLSIEAGSLSELMSVFRVKDDRGRRQNTRNNQQNNRKPGRIERKDNARLSLEFKEDDFDRF